MITRASSFQAMTRKAVVLDFVQATEARLPRALPFPRAVYRHPEVKRRFNKLAWSSRWQSPDVSSSLQAVAQRIVPSHRTAGETFA
jgi:hypothetical protein